MPGSSDLDVLLTDALVVDGTGAEPFIGSVGLVWEKIAFVGSSAEPVPLATKTVDCGGLVLTPGFVDVHTHSDLSFLLNASASSKIMQGVTTDVVGNCGFSPFPVAAPRRDLLGEFLSGLGTPPLEIRWDDFIGYAEAIEERSPIMNVAPLLGHGALRIAAGGVADTAMDLGAMEALLRENLEQGAFGLSTGLTYVPSKFGDAAEIQALARVVQRYDGLYATHSRASEAPYAMFDEAIEVGRRTGVRTLFSHVALNDPRMWGKAADVIARFEAARSEGVDVRYDVYPYDASASSLTQYLPGWVQERGEDGLRELLTDSEMYDAARAELARGLFGSIPWDWRRVVISLADPELEGRSIAEIAEERGVTGEDVCLELCARLGNVVQVVLFYRQESDVADVLMHPLALVGSDGNAMPVDAPGRPHPRSFGTHARLLERYVRERRSLTLADAVHKSTLAPARMLGLVNRGRIAVGAAADLAVFDLEGVRETATWTDPCRLAIGVRHVWVNGRHVVAGGALTGVRSGRVLRRGTA